MNPKTLSVIAVLIVVAGSFYLWQNRDSQFGVPSASLNQVQSNTSTDAETVEGEEGVSVSEINNFDECIAAGNNPLPEASDKCLTKDGHVFIQGVEE